MPELKFSCLSLFLHLCDFERGPLFSSDINIKGAFRRLLLRFCFTVLGEMLTLHCVKTPGGQPRLRCRAWTMIHWSAAQNQMNHVSSFYKLSCVCMTQCLRANRTGFLKHLPAPTQTHINHCPVLIQSNAWWSCTSKSFCFLIYCCIHKTGVEWEQKY